jgi:hypothetical protein
VVIAALLTVVSAFIVGDVGSPSATLTHVYDSHFVIAADDGL